MDYEVVSDTTHEWVLGVSIYDTMALPKLISDSTEVYEQLRPILKSSTKLKYCNEYKSAHCEFIVGTDGQVRQSESTPWVSDGIGMDVNNVITLILTTKWESAFLRESPSERISCPIEVVIRVYRDRIEFELYAPQSYSLLRRTYDRRKHSRG